MTKDQLYFLFEAKQPHEFNYDNKTYNMTFGTDENGNFVSFGLLYEEKKFYSFGEFMNIAKIDNHFFREMLDQF